MENPKTIYYAYIPAFNSNDELERLHLSTSYSKESLKNMINMVVCSTNEIFLCIDEVYPTPKYYYGLAECYKRTPKHFLILEEIDKKANTNLVEEYKKLLNINAEKNIRLETLKKIIYNITSDNLYDYILKVKSVSDYESIKDDVVKYIEELNKAFNRVYILDEHDDSFSLYKNMVNEFFYHDYINRKKFKIVNINENNQYDTVFYESLSINCKKNRIL